MKKLSSRWVNVQYFSVSHGVSSRIQSTDNECWTIFLCIRQFLTWDWKDMTYKRMKVDEKKHDVREEKRMLNPKGNTRNESMCLSFLAPFGIASLVEEVKFFFGTTMALPFKHFRLPQTCISAQFGSFELRLGLIVRIVQWKWSEQHEQEVRKEKHRNVDKLETIAEFLISTSSGAASWPSSKLIQRAKISGRIRDARGWMRTVNKCCVGLCPLFFRWIFSEKWNCFVARPFWLTKRWKLGDWTSKCSHCEKRWRRLWLSALSHAHRQPSGFEC